MRVSACLCFSVWVCGCVCMCEGVFVCLKSIGGVGFGAIVTAIGWYMFWGGCRYWWKGMSSWVELWCADRYDGTKGLME